MKTKFFSPQTDKLLTQLLWGAGAVLLMIIIISAVSQKRESKINDIIININMSPDSSKLITEKDILATITKSLGNNPKGNINANQLDLKRMEERILEKDPFIANADVYIDACSKLHIDIQQREPFLRIIDASGRNYYLDKHGRRMPTSKYFTARVPVATGYIPAYTPEYKTKKNGTIKHLFAFAKKIHQDEFMHALTEQIFVNKKREFIIVPKLGRQKIFFGKNRSIENKIKRLKIFYTEGMPYEGWQKFASINLQYEGQVVCKKRR